MSVTTGGDAISALVETVDARLDAEWAALHEACAADPFRHPDVLRAWGEAFGGGSPGLATVRRDGELVAALPLRRAGRGLASFGDWHSNNTGIVARDEDAAAALARGLLAGQPRTLTFELLDRASADTLQRAAREAGYVTLEETMIESPYLELTGGIDALMAGWPAKRRADHRRRRRRLDELGELTFTSATGGDAAAAVFDELLAIEHDGWKAAEGTAIAQHPETVRYYRELAGVAERHGWLRLFALRLDGRPLAVSLGMAADGVYYGVKMGNDPAHRKHSPGVLMIDELIETCFAEGLGRCELLGANDDYKRQWCPHSHELLRVRAFAPTLSGRLAHAELAYGRPLARRLRAEAARLRRRAGRRLRNRGGAPA